MVYMILASCDPVYKDESLTQRTKFEYVSDMVGNCIILGR